MSIITLTDRISVSVRAKNDSQSSSQKRDTGRNIAKALGNDNISDSLADQIGATAKPTITDENGNEWVSMEDIIAAGKKMKQNGAFERIEEYTYKNKKFIKVSIVESDIGYNVSGGIRYKPFEYTDTGPIYYSAFPYSGNDGRVVFNISSGTNEKTILSSYKSYSIVNGNEVAQTGEYSEMTSGYSATRYVRNIKTVFTDSTYANADTIKAAIQANTEPVIRGGSLIDWDAPNAEVERQIKELHETWDVSEHPGASGQGIGAGTYILAGPIEFNDGD